MLDEKLRKMLEDIESQFTHKMPDEAKYIQWVNMCGKRKLRANLIRKAQQYYEAEQALLENGFHKNRCGKWIKSDGK